MATRDQAESELASVLTEEIDDQQKSVYQLLKVNGHAKKQIITLIK